MRPAQAVALALVATMLVAGCGGSSAKDEPSATDPVVTAFEVEDVECEKGAAVGTVFIEWATANASGVEVAVDSGDPALAEPSGALTLAVPCDGSHHEIEITPLGPAGPGQPEIRTVS